jgi:hypothetical protein
MMFTKMLTTFDLKCEENVTVVELTTVMFHQLNSLKLQRRGQFPDEFVKIEDTQIHCEDSQTHQQ